MSSILDALNKLEEEKKEAARTAAEAAIDPSIAARELIGRTTRPSFQKVSPVLLGLAGIGIFSLVVISAAAGVYFMIRPALQSAPAAIAGTVATANSVATATDASAADSHASPPTMQVAEAAAETVPAPKLPNPPSAAALQASEPAKEVINAEPAPEPMMPAPVPVEPAPAPTPETTPAPSAPGQIEVASNPLPTWVEQAVRPAPPVDPPVATAPAVVATPPPVFATPLRPTPPITATSSPPATHPLPTYFPPVVSESEKEATEAIPADITKLPMLRESDKPRLGFEDITINMLQPKSESRPFARAIINLKPVMIGERIPNTRTTLIGVEINGMAIEVTGSRERYFIPFGYSL